MATLETQQIDAVIDSTRRKLFTVGGAALAGLALAGAKSASAQNTTYTYTDTDILNYALSLEFLGANYYSLALNGVPISGASTPIPTGAGGTGTGGTVTTKPNFAAVSFQNAFLKNYTTQLLADEIGHVTTLQAALGSAAVAQANIDLYNSFNALAVATGLGATFDPFSGGDTNFLLGAYIFEDNDTDAYHGAAGLITNKTGVLAPAVAIHAVEAQHAGLVRSTLLYLAANNGTTAQISQATSAISALRQQLSNNVGDIGLTTQTVTLEGSASLTAATVVDAPTNSQCNGRTFAEILNIATGGNAGGAKNGANYTGGFFPNGINGNIK